MTLTVVAGGPASGKTRRLVERAERRYRADPFAETLVVVPTSRHGDQFRRRLVERTGVALALRVATVAQLSRELAPGAGVVERSVAVELVARATASEIAAGPASYFAPIADAPGLVRSVERAVGELLGEGVAPEELRAAAGTEPLRALGAIYAAVVSGLDERGWTHPAAAPLAAARRPAAVPPLVLVDGFGFLRAVELELVAALARDSEVVLALDPGSGAHAEHTLRELRARLPGARVEQPPGGAGGPELRSGLATDREDQLRGIAREIKDLLTRERSLRPSDCAVAFRRLGPNLALAREVFSEYDLPLDPAAGEPLARRPFGVFARRLIRLGVDGWRLRDLAALLRSDFVDLRRWRLRRGDAGDIMRFGRRQSLWSGLDALGRIATGLDRAGPRGVRAGRGLRAALDELGPLLDPGPATPGERARRLDRALFGPGGVVPAAARDLAAASVDIDAFRGELRSLEATEAALGFPAESAASFAERVERRLEAPAVRLREAGGVLLAPMHTLHGLRFSYLAVGDLVEGQFPAPRLSGDLLDEAAREHLAAEGLALPPRARASEDELWRSARSRSSGRFSAWRTRLGEDGRPAAGSYYLQTLGLELPERVAPLAAEAAASPRELAISVTAAWARGETRRPGGYAPWPLVRAAAPVEQRRRSFEDAGAFEGRLAPEGVPWLTAAEARWSASRLETYQLCPFQFFGRYALRLYEPDEELEAADAATRGTVVHEILQAVVEPLAAAGRPLSAETLGRTLARLGELAPGMWEGAPARHGFGRAALWRLDGERVLDQLEGLLRSEAAWNDEHGVTRVVGTELELTGSLGGDPPLALGAQVDRLDEGEGFVSVVDYKSGSEISRRDVERGRKLQLQLYAELARQHRGAPRVLARYAYLRPQASPWHLDSAEAGDAPILAGAAEAALEVRERVRGGSFQVRPEVPVCPRYCAFQHGCRVNQFSRWKRWS